MNRLATIASLLLAIPIRADGARDPFDPRIWAQAEREIRRVALDAHRGLPKPIATYLHRRGYTIPQIDDNDAQHNVIQGRFNGDRTRDIAVLASRHGQSAILVFWNSSTARIAKLRLQPDSSYLQNVGGGKIGYSRVIGVVGRKYILDHYRGYGGPKPPPIRHDAINHAFAGKSSEVLYFDGRKWRTLQGAD
jgi:hypothetical protein